MDALEQAFTQAAWHQYEDAKRDDYYDERYSAMLQDRGACQTALDLIAGRIQGMFARLCADLRFELTLEWLMLRPQFQPLFTTTELELARHRLVQGGCREALPITGASDGPR